MEVGIEKELDLVEKTVGSDISVKIKKSQRSNETSNGNGKKSKEIITVERPLRNCLPNRNCAVRVIVTSPKYIPRLIIEEAAKKLRNTAEFKNIFRSGKNGLRIRRKLKNNKYVVVAKFRDDYTSLFR